MRQLLLQQILAVTHLALGTIMIARNINAQNKQNPSFEAYILEEETDNTRNRSVK